MADCEKIMRLCDEALDRTLNAEEQQLLEAHLAGCPDCASYMADLQFLTAALGEEPEPPANLHEKIMDGILAETQHTVVQLHAPRRRLPVASMLLAAAACVALVLSGTVGDLMNQLDFGISGAGASGAAADSSAPAPYAASAEAMPAEAAPAGAANSTEAETTSFDSGSPAASEGEPLIMGRSAPESGGYTLAPETSTNSDITAYSDETAVQNSEPSEHLMQQKVVDGAAVLPQVGAFAADVMKGEVFAGCYLVEGGMDLPEIGQAQQRDANFAYYVAENNLSQLETLLDSFEKAGASVSVYEEDGLVFNEGAARVIIVVRV